MGKNRYEYGTSPRKLEERSTKKKTRKLKIVEDLPRQDVQLSKEQKKRQTKLTLTVIAIFALLLTISYRNSQINEKFNQIQSQKRELASLEKENEQLEVIIQNSLNLNNIEKSAKEQLGMQKLTNKQTVYVSLPKKDYVEAASEKIGYEEEKSWFQEFCDWLGF